MTDASLLTVSELQTQFFSPGGVVRAVDGVSFTVDAGEAIGIVGESGSGKSMTALSLLRLISRPGRIVGGSIMLGDRDILGLGDREMRTIRATEVAMIFQDPGSYLNPIMTIGDQIAEAIGKRGSKEPDVVAQVLDALKAVQIPDPARIADSYPHELSGGMQQRAMIASVLIRRPRLIIADEPTTALDATVQFQILKFLAELRTRIGAALILISHDLAVVAEVCDRVYIMYAGQFVEHGRTKDVFDAPTHPYTKALVGSVLDPWLKAADLPGLEGAPPDMAAPPSGCRFHPRCSSAMAKCREIQPTLADFGERRAVACWLYQSESNGP